MAEDAVQIKIQADATDLQAQMAKAESALKKLSETVQGTTTGLNPLNAATAQFIQQYDRAAGTLTKAQMAFQATSDAMEANEISAGQAARMFGQISQQAEEAAGAEGRFATGTVGARREMLVMAHEVVSGNWSRIPGSIMVLGERVGGLGGIFGLLASPVGVATMALVATAGACVSVVSGAENAERAINQLQTAFAAVGNGGRMSNQALAETVDQIARLPGVTREAATEITADFGRTRQIGGQLFDELTASIDRSARAMNTDAPSAAKTLASAFADPAKGAQELHDKYNILDQAQLNEIQTTQRQGDLVGAQNVLWQAWKQRLDEMPPSLTAIQTASNNLGNAWDSLMHSIGQSSAWQTARDGVASLLDVMARKIDPTPLDNYNKALDNYTRLTNKLAAQKNGLFGDLGTGQLKAEVAKAKADLDAAQEAMLKAAEPKKTSAAPDTNQPSTAADAAAEIRQAHPGDGTQIKVLNDQIGVLNKDLDTARSKLAELANTKGTDSNEYKAEKAIVDQDIASLAKLKEEKDSIGRTTDTGASQLQQWRTELEQQHAASQANQAQMLRDDIAFWQAKRANLQTGSKDAVEVDREIARAQVDLNKEMLKDAQQAAKDRQEIARQDADADIAISKTELATNKQLLDDGVSEGAITAQEKIQILEGFTEASYQEDLTRLQNELATLGSTTKEYDRVYNEIRKLKASHNQEMAVLDRQAADETKKQAEASAKSWEQAFAPASRAFDSMVQGVMMGTQTIQQAVARAGLNMAASYAAEVIKMIANFLAFETMQALGWTKMAAAVGTSQTKELAEVVKGESQKTAATETGNATRQASEETEQTTFFSRIASEIGSWFGLESAKTGATTTGVAARTGAEATGAATTKATDVATAESSIGAKAADAAAGAYDAMAGIPIVGPVLGAAAAAATFTAVLAYGAIASAEGGWGQVPYDGAMAVLHKNEMVLPASLAQGVRNMTGSAQAVAASATGNAVTLNHAPTINMTGSSGLSRSDLETALRNHGDVVHKFIRNAARNGVFDR